MVTSKGSGTLTFTTLTSREFNRDTSSAKTAAANGPVFITDRGRPTHVLLTIEDYRRLSGGPISLAEALAQPDGDFDFVPPRVGTLAEFLLASPLRGADLDTAREHHLPRDIEP